MPRGESAAGRYWPLSLFVVQEAWLGRWAGRQPVRRRTYEFLRFGLKQGWACLFGGLMLALLLATHFFHPPDATLARYDFLLIGAVLIQAAMLAFGLETWQEFKVILAFHAVGTVMEVFKTATGSWAYPEPSLLRIGGVPLFSGFMYAAVGSYLARAWRLFDFEFSRHPPLWSLWALSAAIYVNFFAHHYVADMRLALFVAAAALLGPCFVSFRVWRTRRAMPLLAGLALVALFIWFAENIATFARAWTYPSQAAGWEPVSFAKFGSWFLLMLISYTLVATIHGVSARRTGAASRGVETAEDAA